MSRLLLPWQCFIACNRGKCDVSEVGISVYKSSDVGIIRRYRAIKYSSLNFKDVQQWLEGWVSLWLGMHISLTSNNISKW